MLDKPTEGDTLDLEHRMDRSDWLSIVGCARDLAAFENLDLVFPELYEQKGKELPEEEKIKIEVTCPDKVNRFNTRVFKNINVKESPQWLKYRLESYGIPSINNIVDITNYVMIELGQPMHAQDIDKMGAKEVVIRDAKKGEKVVTLLGEVVELVEENFVLTQNDKPTVIGGIVGGKDTGIDKDTKNILLDAGNYNQVYIRKASRKLKIQNETVLRYDKFLHPHLAEIAIKRATKLILDIAGGEFYENQDWYPDKKKLKTQLLRIQRIKKLSGINFEMDRVKIIITKLGYKILKEENDTLELEVPYFRTDVEVEDDVVADILRINNYSNIPFELIQAAPPKEITPKIYEFEDKLRDICVTLGLHEHITEPLIDKNILGKDIDKAVVLENALSSDKSALRTNIKQTLNNVVKTYKKHKIDEIKIFEIGKVYYKTLNNEYEEKRFLVIMYVNQKLSIKEGSDILKRIISGLIRELGIEWGSAKKIWDITPTSVSINTEELMKIQSNSNRVVSEIPNYTIEDISIVLDIDKTFGEVYEDIKINNDHIKDINVIEEFKVDDNTKSILIRLTLDTPDTNDIRENIIKKISKKDGFSVRR